MTWQDLAIAFSGLLFSAGLVPTVLRRTRVPIPTVLSMVTGLALITLAVGSLHLWTSTVATALQLTLWMAVGIRGRRATTPDQR